MEKQIEELQKNPYFDKYANKIAKLQKTSPEEFLNRLATAEEAKKSTLPIGEAAKVEEKDWSLPSRPKGGASGMVKEKSLSDVMKVELLKDKDAGEIAELWHAHHQTKDCVAAVIPAEMYKQMKKRFEQFNTFLFPLPRKQGYEFMVVAFSGNEAHFTTLINYQAFTENAPECLTMVHYTDLMESKGIVLMVGEFDKNVLTHDESACLGVQTLLYYGDQDGGKKLAHLHRFTYETDSFNHIDLLAELEASRNVPLSPVFNGA